MADTKPKPRTKSRRAAAALAAVPLLLGLAANKLPTATTAPAPVAHARAAEDINLQFGPDHCDGPMLNETFYVVCYNPQWRVPTWVMYHLDKAELAKKAPRKDHFRPDTLLPDDERSELADYAKSAYSRGHMAPANDFTRSATAMDASFLLSNMAPQLQGLNGGRWARLEAEVHKLAGTEGNIWVITGPLFLDAHLKPTGPKKYTHPDHRVAVPTHFFKAVLGERADGTHDVFAFVMENKNGLPGPSLLYAVSVHDIEEMSGVNLFSLLPEVEQARLEATATTVWPVK